MTGESLLKSSNNEAGCSEHKIPFDKANIPGKSAVHQKKLRNPTEQK